MNASAERVLPRLHIVTDSAVLAAPEFEARAAQVLAAGGERIAVHVRGHETAAARLYAIARLMREHATRSGALLFVNDRVDVALAVHADGLQLGRRGIPVPDARTLFGSGWIGYSAHAPAEAASTVRNGTDYLLLGTIWESASHAGSAAAGTALIEAAAALTDAPLLGIGGVTPERVGALQAAGAYGAAVLGGIWHAAEPARAVEQYLTAIADAYASAHVKE